jgi:hypothetical protein
MPPKRSLATTSENAALASAVPRHVNGLAPRDRAQLEPGTDFREEARPTEHALWLFSGRCKTQYLRSLVQKGLLNLSPAEAQRVIDEFFRCCDASPAGGPVKAQGATSGRCKTQYLRSLVLKGLLNLSLAEAQRVIDEFYRCCDASPAGGPVKAQGATSKRRGSAESSADVATRCEPAAKRRATVPVAIAFAGETDPAANAIASSLLVEEDDMPAVRIVKSVGLPFAPLSYGDLTLRRGLKAA